MPAPKGMYYYEVKTTLGDGGQIELGETQVIAAQEHAKNGRWLVAAFMPRPRSLVPAAPVTQRLPVLAWNATS